MCDMFLKAPHAPTFDLPQFCVTNWGERNLCCGSPEADVLHWPITSQIEISCSQWHNPCLGVGRTLWHVKSSSSDWTDSKVTIIDLINILWLGTREWRPYRCKRRKSYMKCSWRIWKNRKKRNCNWHRLSDASLKSILEKTLCIPILFHCVHAKHLKKVLYIIILTPLF